HARGDWKSLAQITGQEGQGEGQQGAREQAKGQADSGRQDLTCRGMVNAVPDPEEGPGGDVRGEDVSDTERGRANRVDQPELDLRARRDVDDVRNDLKGGDG